MLIKGRHSESLQYAINVLAKPEYKKWIKEIYLYGSCARGTQKYTSDVDLFLFVHSETPDKVIRSMKSEVIPDDYALPEVELMFSRGTQFSSIVQFNRNLQKEARLLWKE